MPYAHLIDTPNEKARYVTLASTLRPCTSLFSGRRVLDFGASYALFLLALIELGASAVVGVEPDTDRARKGQAILFKAGVDHVASLKAVGYEPALEFRESEFAVVMANAVLEHIPPPRAPSIRELWRVLRQGCYLIMNESPNKCLSFDLHTTYGLLFVPWLPEELPGSMQSGAEGSR